MYQRTRKKKPRVSFICRIVRVACEQARRLGKTKRNWSRREGKNGGACWHTIEVAIPPFWTNLSLICQWLIMNSTWIHWNVNRLHVKLTARAKIHAFLHLLWTNWNGGKVRWRRGLHDSYVRDSPFAVLLRSVFRPIIIIIIIIIITIIIIIIIIIINFI